MLNYIGYLFLGFLILVIIGLIPLFKRLKQLIKSSGNNFNNFNNFNNLGEKLVVITENYEDEAPYSSRPIKCSRKDFEDIKDATNFVKSRLINNYLPFANDSSSALLPEDLHQELLNSFDNNDSAYISTNETKDNRYKDEQSDNEYVFTFTNMNLSNNFNGNNINNSDINIQ